ncbi:MAG: hypothetical protein KC646_08025 [Candidatus Cloacimonetes bacterium]|nr:hypothetical protein [Candidatus Cloacimonadota bacterium]
MKRITFNVLIIALGHALNSMYYGESKLTIELLLLLAFIADDMSGYLFNGAIRRWSFRPISMNEPNERELHLGGLFVVICGLLTYNMLKTIP